MGYTFLQDEVARLCLEWWQAELPGREVLSPQTVPYLLMKALATGRGLLLGRAGAGQPPGGSLLLLSNGATAAARQCARACTGGRPGDAGALLGDSASLSPCV